MTFKKKGGARLEGTGSHGPQRQAAGTASLPPAVSGLRLCGTHFAPGARLPAGRGHSPTPPPCGHSEHRAQGPVRKPSFIRGGTLGPLRGRGDR